MERYSTAPPPMVPRMEPSLQTSIFAPLPRGVEPLEAITLTSTAFSPEAISSRRAEKIFSIVNTP